MPLRPRSGAGSRAHRCQGHSDACGRGREAYFTSREATPARRGRGIGQRARRQTAANRARLFTLTCAPNALHARAHIPAPCPLKHLTCAPVCTHVEVPKWLMLLYFQVPEVLEGFKGMKLLNSLAGSPRLPFRTPNRARIPAATHRTPACRGNRVATAPDLTQWRQLA